MSEPPAPIRIRPTSSLVGGVLLGLLVTGIGVLFCGLLWIGFRKARAMDEWQATRCTILQSDIESYRPTPHSPPTHRWLLEYAYVFEGERYTSERFKKMDGPTGHRQNVEARLKEYAPGSTAVCYVNLDDPTWAVLKRDTKAPGYTLWFPALFVLGGLGVIGGSVRNFLRCKRNS